MVSPSSPDSSSPARERILVVLRHGKAEAYGEDDHRRRLTDRGRREATSAGEWLATAGFAPTHAIVSSSSRTQETWDCVLAGAGVEAPADVSEAAYSAGAHTTLEILKGAPADAAVLVLVGHNPTASSLIHLLDDGDPDPGAFRVVTTGLPTSGLAVLRVSVPWADIDVATARLVASHTPHD